MYILYVIIAHLYLLCNSSRGEFPGLRLNIDSQQHKYQHLNIHVRNRMTYHLFPIGKIKLELFRITNVTVRLTVYSMLH